MIKRMWVKNYRSLADVTIEFEPLTVLVGYNGAGKSNLIDVLRFTADILQLGLQTAVSKRNGINALLYWGHHGPNYGQIEIGYQLETENLSGTYAFSILVKPTTDKRGSYRIYREACNLHLDGQNGSNPFIYEMEEDQWLVKPAGTEPAIQSNALILPLLSGISAYKLLYDWLIGMSFYRVGFPDVKGGPQKSASAQSLTESGENLASVLDALPLLYRQKIDSALHAAIPDITEFAVAPSNDYLFVYLKHYLLKDGHEYVNRELGQESDGTLRILGILAAIHQQPPRSLIGIEEPELNIHIGALPVLWEEFEEASQHSQIILTTHSPDLLNLCEAEQLRIVDKEDGTTRIAMIEESQKQIIQKRLFAPGQLLQAEGLHSALA
ncbi:MAG: AAA family ATPase [Candidatus Promineifilaceae bacterium]